MKKYLVALTLCLSLFFATTASAASILYYVDHVVGTDYMGQALTASSHSVNTVSDSATFASEIATGNYDLGILMIQNTSASNYADAITALGAFVTSGGSSIYTDWSLDAASAALFGASWTGNTNNDSFTISNPALAVGLGGNVSLSNPGWGVFSMGVSGSEIAGLFSNNDGAIAIANGGRSITNGFLTDTFADGGQGVQLYLNEIGYVLGDVTSVPEPSTILLLGLGLVGVAFMRRRN